MIFRLLGQNINTENIISVSELIEPNKSYFHDELDEFHDEKEWLDRFVIQFVGGTKMTVTILDTENNMEILDNTQKQVMKYWLENQSSIPVIL